MHSLPVPMQVVHQLCHKLLLVWYAIQTSTADGWQSYGKHKQVRDWYAMQYKQMQAMWYSIQLMPGMLGWVLCV